MGQNSAMKPDDVVNLSLRVSSLILGAYERLHLLSTELHKERDSDDRLMMTPHPKNDEVTSIVKVTPLSEGRGSIEFIDHLYFASSLHHMEMLMTQYGRENERTLLMMMVSGAQPAFLNALLHLSDGIDILVADDPKWDNDQILTDCVVEIFMCALIAEDVSLLDIDPQHIMDVSNKAQQALLERYAEDAQPSTPTTLH